MLALNKGSIRAPNPGKNKPSQLRHGETIRTRVCCSATLLASEQLISDEFSQFQVWDLPVTYHSTHPRVAHNGKVYRSSFSNQSPTSLQQQNVDIHPYSYFLSNEIRTRMLPADSSTEDSEILTKDSLAGQYPTLSSFAFTQSLPFCYMCAIEKQCICRGIR